MYNINVSEKEIILLIEALEYYLEEAEIPEMDEEVIRNEMNILVNKLMKIEKV